MTHKAESLNENLRNLSHQDFLNFGLEQVAYIRPVKLDDKTAFMIHAADGTPLSVLDSEESASFMVRYNDLERITVH